MGDYHSTKSRPNKCHAITRAILAGIQDGTLRHAIERGVMYYTLGGMQFNDLKLFFNVLGDRIKHAVSFEKKPGPLKAARAGAKMLMKSGQIGLLPLEVLSGDILTSDLRVVPRGGAALILFLDLTEFLTLDHQRFFQDWMVGKCLLPGDLIFLTSSLPPWMMVNEDFRRALIPILRDQGVEASDLASNGFWKRHYVPAAMSYLAGTWQHYQLSPRGLRHFFGETYRDSKFEMCIHAFTVT